MSVLENLEPKRVFHYFEELSKIPRASYHEEKVSAWLVKFAEEHNLEHYTDEVHNVIMIKPAAKGYEDQPAIILQGHMDMVCEKVAGLEKNMIEEGLDIKEDGKYVYAEGTTLGGDDGIAVAYALALLEDETLKAPRLEFVCTVSEEVGMDGARAIDLSMLEGNLVLNMDSEVEGTLLAGCAGGASAKVALPVEWEKKKGTVVSVKLEGFTGGHSGVEIIKQRGNASVLFARLLSAALDEGRAYVISYRGGLKENAIPKRGEGQLLVLNDDVDAVLQGLRTEADHILSEYHITDPELRIEIEKAEVAEKTVLTSECTESMAALLQALPNGIQRMSVSIENMPETSLNLGICKLSNQGLFLQYAVRSAYASARDDLDRKLRVIATYFGAEVNFGGEYPAWEYNETSPFRDKMVHIYEEMFGETPKIDTIHAGLECGLLSDKIKNLDAVSMGPNILDIHTTDERLDIASTERMYRYIRQVLETK